jgi:hypothetical protein
MDALIIDSGTIRGWNTLITDGDTVQCPLGMINEKEALMRGWHWCLQALGVLV